MAKKHDVFISYSSLENEKAYQVKSTLEAHGIRCWMAPESIPGGSDYTTEIPRAISEAKAIVLVFSTNAQNSTWVYSELKQAHDHGKVIIPYAIEDCPIQDKLDNILSRRQRIPAYEGKDDASDQLVKTTLKTIHKIDKEKKKRIIRISAICAAVLVLALAACFVYLAKTDTVSGTTGDCEWHYSKSKQTLTITGEGQMGNYTIDFMEIPYINYIQQHDYNITSIEVADGVTSVGDYAFQYASAKTVKLADSVTDIGASAFHDSEIESIKLPSGLEHIGDSAFSGCNKLKEVEIPDSVLTIDNYAFSFCESLTDIKIPEGLTVLGTGVFQYSKSLQSVYIPGTLKTLPDSCFVGCKMLESVTLEEGIEEIGNWEFSDCTSLTHIEFPDSLTTIKGGAFSGCSSLDDFSIGKNIRQIEVDAFFGTAETSVTIENSETVLQMQSFGYRRNSEGKDVIKDDYVIRCPKGSGAQKYADLWGLKTEFIDQ